MRKRIIALIGLLLTPFLIAAAPPVRIVDRLSGGQAKVICCGLSEFEKTGLDVKYYVISVMKTDTEYYVLFFPDQALVQAHQFPYEYELEYGVEIRISDMHVLSAHFQR